MSADQENISPKDDSILGLSTRELAGITVDELLDNKSAITMMMHYYKKLVDENNTFKNDLNTLRTYVDGYQRKKLYSTVSAALLTCSNIFIGFGVGILTSSNPSTVAGTITLIAGIVMIGFGLYFSCKED
jgi:hypothetical protein